MISFTEMLLRLGLALVLGALIGLEREHGEHAAGLRTLSLVSLGSSLFTIISAYAFTGLLSIPHTQIDPTRIASYVVAGIGFLGGGAIFLSQNRVKGLTTAAAIWLVAALGLACGAGLYVAAATATALALIVLIGLRYVEHRLLPPQFYTTNMHHIQVEATSVAGPFIGQVYDACARSHITVETLELHTEKEVETVSVTCQIVDAATLAHSIDELRALPGVRAVNTHLLTNPKGDF